MVQERAHAIVDASVLIAINHVGANVRYLVLPIHRHQFITVKYYVARIIAECVIFRYDEARDARAKACILIE